MNVPAVNVPLLPVTVVTAGPEDLVWEFGAGPPSVKYGWRSAQVDPFPAYPHDVAEVTGALALVTAAWPPSRRTPMTYHVLPWESLSRSNAEADRRINWDDATKAALAWDGYVIISGKRIPPHPAVTRYLVAHEWGHHVEWWLEAAKGYGIDRDEFLRYYASIRGGLGRLHASGGRWHEAAAEVLACDFRILVACVERDFWPHPGIPRPEEAPGLWDWWRETSAWWRERIATEAVPAAAEVPA